MYSILVGTEKGLVPLGNIGSTIYPWVESLRDIPINALQVSTLGVHAITNANKVLHCKFDGEQSETEKAPFPITCLHDWQGDILAGTYEAHLLRVNKQNFATIRSFEDTPQRNKWFTPWGAPASIRSMASLGNDLFVNVHVGGVMHTNNGTQWEQMVDIDIDVHQVITATLGQNRILVATGMAGLGESTDNGKTWRYTSEGMHASYCRALAVSDSHLLISCSDDHHGRHSTVYARPLAAPWDHPFVACNLEPTWFNDPINTYCLGAFGSDVAFGTKTGEVYVSRDGGENWYQVIVGLPAINCLLVLPDLP